ncbi:MAG TPA: PQQ-binding-like beta-propeller repeat protein [Gemmataceae bacterium]|nr:PQQ-binding-like beta-propeller repeat protein [Gemmataceae bacterium]
MRQATFRLLMAGIGPVLFAHAVIAQDWPQFRGPDGSGVTKTTDLPLTWGGPKKDNVLWTSDLAGDGIASPIVWKDRVFVMNASRKADDKKIGRDYPEQYVACYDANDGKRLWNTVVATGPWKRSHNNRAGGGFANCTPATDGQRVYALFGTSVLVALDFNGKLVWRQDITPHRYDMEMATSPILFEDNVIVYCGMQNGSRLVAFNRKTGDIAWDTDLKDTGYGHNTPLVIDVKSSPQMILMGAGLGPAKNAIQSFDPRTGKRLWWSAGRGETASPVLARGFVFCDSGRGGGAKLVDPTGMGDVTKTHVKWEANVPHALSSPIVVGNHIYRVHDNNTLTCWDIDTGKKLYQERVEGLSSNWASPIADGQGRIYLASAGTTVVMKAGPTYEVLATNKLGDNNHASPAVAAGRIYLVGTKQLYAIGAK